MATFNQQIRIANFNVILGVVIGLLIIIILSSSIVIVKAGERVVVFNKFSGGLDGRAEGMTFVIPFVQESYRYDIKTQTYTMSSIKDEGEQKGDDAIEALTKDQQKIKIDLSIRYHPDPDRISELHKKVGWNYVEKVVRPEIRSVIRTMAAAYTVIEVSSEKRVEMQNRMGDELKRKFEPNYLVLDDVLVRNIVFSDEFQKAVEAKQVAQQEAERMKYVLEKERKEKERKVIEATGESEALRLKGKALAENPKLIQYEYVQKITPGVKAVITDQNTIINFGDIFGKE